MSATGSLCVFYCRRAATVGVYRIEGTDGEGDSLHTLRGCMIIGIGILPMLHGLEAHATKSRLLTHPLGLPNTKGAHWICGPALLNGVMEGKLAVPARRIGQGPHSRCNASGKGSQTRRIAFGDPNPRRWRATRAPRPVVYGGEGPTSVEPPPLPVGTRKAKNASREYSICTLSSLG
jgi:hypothetical protein